MNKACVEFGMRSLTVDDVRGRTVLEVGSRDVNGSLRGHVEGLAPASYLGVDIVGGLGVDEICPADCLIDRFGSDQFDLVFSTEMLEHVRDWRADTGELRPMEDVAKPPRTKDTPPRPFKPVPEELAPPRSPTRPTRAPSRSGRRSAQCTRARRRKRSRPEASTRRGLSGRS